MAFDLQNEAFRVWFWTSSNGNDLIEYLNQAETTDRICREKKSQAPHIYGIVVNNCFRDEETKLVKVGFTQVSTVPDSNNRMEQVMTMTDQAMRNINEGIEKAQTLFVLQKSAIDTTALTKCEQNMREKVGIQLPKEVARSYGLPVPTEWVVAKQSTLREITTYVKAAGHVHVSKVTGRFRNAVSEFSDVTELEMINGDKIKIDKEGHLLP